MPIYQKPTKELMYEFARSELQPGQIFGKKKVVDWFRSKYPKIKSNTVELHVEGMSVNSLSRRHHPSIKMGSGHDLFFKIKRGEYRLFEKMNDPAPRYGDSEYAGDDFAEDPADNGEERGAELNFDFQYEKELQKFIARNLNSIEPGLALYEDEGLTGIEYPAGARRIDVLAKDKDGRFVVIELKLSKTDDRVLGQVAYYMAWVRENLAKNEKVRSFVVAGEISDNLRLAATILPDVKLVKYKMTFSIDEIS